MAGRAMGRPTKWVTANIGESVGIGRTGVTFEVWSKWKKKRKKLGTLVVSVGGLHWWPHKATMARLLTWNEFAESFNPSDG